MIRRQWPANYLGGVKTVTILATKPKQKHEIYNTITHEVWGTYPTEAKAVADLTFLQDHAGTIGVIGMLQYRGR